MVKEKRVNVYCADRQFHVIQRGGDYYDETGNPRQDIRQDTCFTCGGEFLISDQCEYPDNCPMCNAVFS